MDTNLVNIGLGFFEGLALIVSPCILPILPIILAGSLAGSKKRPIGIITGFILIFAIFTFFSRKLVQLSGIDTNLIRHASYVILALLGVIMLSTYLTEKFAIITQRLVGVGSSLSSANNPEGGFWSGLLFGSLVAFIWTPCAGPILAAVIVQTVIQESTFMSFIVLLAFGLGAAIPMFIIAMFGRGIMQHFGFVKQHTILFRKLLGLVILLSIGYMIYFEGAVTTSYASTTDTKTPSALEKGLSSSYPAPAIAGIDAWINSPPLTISELKGKVVLIDFWTYSCINCIRTFPYLKGWYAKYHDKGLVIIGVHSPEFDFEKKLSNVENAVKQYDIKYPVALDNQFVTWRNYQNKYWPAHYLIDKNGDVVYTHFGEGEYDTTENNIRYLLGIDDQDKQSISDSQSYSMFQTPETYFGYERSRFFSSPERVVRDDFNQYTFPEDLGRNDWALSGKWKIMSDRIVSGAAGSALELHFYARQVFVVMGTVNNENISATIKLDGKELTDKQGKDVKQSKIDVNRHTLYELVVLPEANDGILSITASAPGLEIYTFTFG